MKEWFDKVEFFNSPSFDDLLLLLLDLESNGELLFPNFDDVLAPFDINPHSVRVLIVGEKPYQSEKCNPIPFLSTATTTFGYMDLEMRLDVGYKMDENTIPSWIDQGVLLLNHHMTATLLESHDWGDMIISVIKYLVTINPKLVVWLMGSAIDLPLVFVPKTTTVIRTLPPSINERGINFMGSRPYSRINAALTTDICWGRRVNTPI